MRRTSLVLLLVGSIGLAGGCRASNARGGGGHAAETEPWVRTELYFGLGKPGGGTVSDEEWADFLNRSVTPRFPDGLTVVQGQGRYRSQDQQLHEEPTRLLIILHPRASFGESDGKIRQLCWDYIRRFEQESVLRSDSTSQTSFITAGQQGAVQEPAGDASTRTLSK
jgi:hypothetical protein